MPPIRVRSTLQPRTADAAEARRFIEGLVDRARSRDNAGLLTYSYFEAEDAPGAWVCVEAFRSSEDLIAHMGSGDSDDGQGNSAEAFMAMFDVTSIEVYGPPSDALRELLSGWGARFLSLTAGVDAV